MTTERQVETGHTNIFFHWSEKDADMDAIGDMIESLAHEDEIVRRVAIFDLVEIGAESVGALIKAIGDARPVVRAGAISALGRIGCSDTEVVSQLISSLCDESQHVRERAAESLAKLGTNAIHALLSCLTHEKSDVQARAAEALGQIGQAAATALPSLMLLLNHQDPFVRIQSAIAAGKVGPSFTNDFISRLSSAIRCRDELMAESLVIALGETGKFTDDVYVALVNVFMVGPERARLKAIDNIRRFDPTSKVTSSKRSLTFDDIRRHILTRWIQEHLEFS